MPDATPSPSSRYDVSPYRASGRSTFRSGEPGSAIWFMVRGGRTMLLRSQGLAAIQSAQCALGVEPDGVWGPRVSAALRRSLFQRGLDTSIVRDGTVTREMLQAALLVAFGSAGAPDPAAPEWVVVPEGTELPRWMRKPPPDGEYRGLVWGGEVPTSTTMPPATEHPNYGRAAVCAPPTTGAVYVSPIIDVGPAAGLGDAEPSPLRPVQSFSSPITVRGDSVTLSRGVLAGVVLTVAALAAAAVIAGGPSAPRPMPTT